MGLKKDQLEFIFRCIDKKYSQYSNLRMLELGNQVLKIDGTRRSAKPFFEEMGFEHTSVDINGKDDALPVDLSVSIEESLKKEFDIVTNFGLNEHVEPFGSQYQWFKNIHDFTRAGGLMIHAVPNKGHYPNHCRFYYDQSFFRKLAVLNDYKILDLGIIRSGKLVCAGLVKQHDQEFTRLAKEVRRGIEIRSCTRKAQPRNWRASKALAKYVSVLGIVLQDADFKTVADNAVCQDSLLGVVRSTIDTRIAVVSLVDPA